MLAWNDVLFLTQPHNTDWTVGHSTIGSFEIKVAISYHHYIWNENIFKKLSSLIDPNHHEVFINRNLGISFGCINFHPKIFEILYDQIRNSTTGSSKRKEGVCQRLETYI